MAKPSLQVIIIGAGLQFSANATRILNKWGIDKAIIKDVVEPSNCIMRRYKDGSQLASLELGAYHNKTYGAPFWDIHRHDLIIALYERALELGADIRVSSKVVDVDFESGAVILEKGHRLTADLVVGADGLNSITRRKFVVTDAPEYTGDIAFRILLDMERLDQDDEILKNFTQNPQVTYWLGPKGHAIVYILKGGRQINIVAIAPDDLPPDVIRAPLSKEETLQKFGGWDPVLRKLIANSHDDVIWRWKLHMRPELDKWNHPAGRFTLLGDAVHPSLPYLSQGAGMALEDAAVLGHVLSQSIPLAAALAQYEILRRPRSTKVVRAAKGQQYWYHLPDGEEQKRRDSMIGAEESCNGDPFLWREPVFSPWLYGYDAYKEAEIADSSGLINGYTNGHAN
ncbi:putative fad binding domain-containing protein [Phaeoacremonium minimum UCRPA7]|uniref:Putative fad binding domain-containing protein n=1 Tax=Phaeoacremonium minimum (strain UCR-PA7) TaxID=1286976 RepID=R8BHQ8_PHAM7|nr:putative fad binding domain-containing protein [Phaeoacremonium minimum UCRPA7]EON98870.1 putative fad binding domain-containing protein [Phaeoacremonium minimum UCRPA7]